MDNPAKTAQSVNGLSDGSKRGPVAWSALAVSILFSAVALEMLNLYAIVHWQIMFAQWPGVERPPQAVFTVLGHLWCLRIVFAALGVIWAILSFRGCPRWASIFALTFSIVTLATTMIVM